RRVGAGAGAQSSGRPARGARPRLHLHLAQPRGGELPRRPHRGDVRRPHRGARARRGALPQSRAPLHARAACRGAGAGSRAQARFRRAHGRQGLRPHGLAGGIPHRCRYAARAAGHRPRAPGESGMRRLAFFLLAVLPGLALAQNLLDPPMLRLDVSQGKLPALEKRLPQPPLVVQTDTPGRHGGTLHSLVGRSRDTRLLVVYGYARLIGYDRDLNLVPDILESYEVQEGRIFTLKLRKGHRWSDGQPFTTEDFRYYWEDVANNKELSPAGPPVD